MITFALAHSGNLSIFLETLKMNFTLNFSLIISSFSIALVISPSSSSDTKILYCGGLIKIRTKNREFIDEYLLLGLLNSYIVKRQIRTKQFTRDVIDTLGRRLNEVVIPIPKSEAVREEISNRVKQIVERRII